MAGYQLMVPSKYFITAQSSLRLNHAGTSTRLRLILFGLRSYLDNQGDTDADCR